MKNRILHKVIVALLLAICTASGAQAGATGASVVNRITTQEGLSNGTVTCFLQDKKGFIWIGTADGLNKYDGYRMTVYKHNPRQPNTIGGNSIRCLYEDSRNNLWIGLRGGGLSRMDLTTGRVTTFRHEENAAGLSYDDIAGIVEDLEGNLWIAVDRGGLDCFDPRTETFTHYSPKLSTGEPLNNALTDIAFDAHGTLWLSSWGGGVYCFDIRSRLFGIHPLWKGNAQHVHNVYDLNVDPNDVVWISTHEKGLYAVDPAQNTCTPYAGPSASILFTFADKENHVWVAQSTGGTFLLDKEKNALSPITVDEKLTDVLQSDIINCVFQDRDASIWIGTSAGVYFYNPLTSQFNWVRMESKGAVSLSEEAICALMKDSRGNVWVGSVNCIDRINPSRTSIDRCISLPNANSHRAHTFQAFCETTDGTVWIGSYATALLKYTPSTNGLTSIEIPSPPGMNVTYRNVYGIYEDWDHTLWLSTELGAVNYHPATGVFTPLFESKQIIYPEEKTHVIYRDRDLELWVGTEGGLRRYSRDLKLLKIYVDGNDSTSISNNFVTAIKEDVDGTLWIGTLGGLHRLNKGTETFELIKRPEVEYGDPILGLSEDANGNFWMSITTGVVKYTPLDGSFYLYDASDGLQNRGFKQGAFFQARDGELLLGGNDGLNTFYPERIKTNERIPTVAITDFQIFNQSITPQEEGGILTRLISETTGIRIKYSQSVISLQFVALNFVSPSKNRYQYKMEGFDDNWITTGADQRTATYTNLNPGRYTFLVKASNNDGVWNPQPTRLSITIDPPFWLTGYAYVLYLLVLVGLVYLLIRYFTVRERDRNNLEMAKFEARQIREIDDMKFNLFTNISHEFRTPLSLILGPLTQIIKGRNYKDEDESVYMLMHRNAQRLLRLINQLLDFQKIEAGKLELNLKYDDIVRFITELTSMFVFSAEERNIRYITTSTIVHSWMNFDPDKLDKILYNLISNAFQYTPEGGRVEVNLAEAIEDNRPYLQISVSDTGIGITEEEKEKLFTAFYQGKRRKTLRNTGSGIGLALTKELVDLYGGKITVEDSAGGGTVFTVLLPIVEEKVEKEVLSVAVVKETSGGKQAPSPEEKLPSSADVILVVEDNADMRMYIERILVNRFKVVTAANGEEAFGKAVECIPDLIVSDVMMPVMDGLELVKALRTNESTNHIPVILLTAKSAEPQVLEGYKTGADDYITKPFSEEMLLVRVDNLLTTRKKMWEQYKQSKDMDEYKGKLAEDPKKQEFVRRVNEIILSHIQEPDFDVEALADALKMSPNQLSRKMKAMMDTTPYNIILQVRMTHAAKLMKETELTISEIAYAVSYQELSNFSRAFKKYHNVSPREYTKTT